MREQFPFTAETVLEMLRIEGKPRGNEVVAHCPIEGCPDKSGHLFINLKNDKINCQRCGWVGNTLTFYAQLTGMSNKDAYHDIMERAGLKDKGEDYHKEIQKKRAMEAEKAKSSALLPIEERDKVYNALLDELYLSKDHMQNLFGRGFEEYMIYLKKYRTSPPRSGKEIYNIPKILQNQGYSLQGVPGFHKNANGQWEFARLKRSILVPVRDSQNRIQAIQHRLDDEVRKKKPNGKLEDKYKWVSTEGWNGFSCGTGAHAFIHFACDFSWDGKRMLPIPKTDKRTGKLFFAFTEGPMKADLSYQLTGTPFFASAGVKALKILPDALIELKKVGVELIYDCFDMDYMEKEDVAKASKNVEKMVVAAGMKYERKIWNKTFKGIDNYYAFKLKGIV